MYGKAVFGHFGWVRKAVNSCRGCNRSPRTESILKIGSVPWRRLGAATDKYRASLNSFRSTLVGPLVIAAHIMTVFNWVRFVVESCMGQRAIACLGSRRLLHHIHMQSQLTRKPSTASIIVLFSCTNSAGRHARQMKEKQVWINQTEKVQLPLVSSLLTGIFVSRFCQCWLCQSILIELNYDNEKWKLNLQTKLKN